MKTGYIQTNNFLGEIMYEKLPAQLVKPVPMIVPFINIYGGKKTTEDFRFISKEKVDLDFESLNTFILLCPEEGGLFYSAHVLLQQIGYPEYQFEYVISLNRPHFSLYNQFDLPLHWRNALAEYRLKNIFGLL